MPRQMLVVIVFSAFASIASAQTDFNFADSTAQWNYLAVSYGPAYLGGDSSGYVFSTDVWTASGDTIIGTTAYQRVKSKNYYGSYLDVFVRKDSVNNIYLWSSSGDKLMYNFAAQKGDTFFLPFNVFVPDLRASIDSVDSIYLGKWRKRMFVTYMSATASSDIDDFNPYWGNDVWIAGIGAFYSWPFAPGFKANYEGGPDYSVLCFSENNVTLYLQSPYDSCNINSITGINQEPGEIGIKIYPNPVTDNLLHIQFTASTNQATDFRLFDITGRMVLQKPLLTESNTIGMNEISKGIYFYSINSSAGRLMSGKIIVQ